MNQAVDILQWVRPNIRSLKPYSSARSEFKGSADIFLDANENPFENGMNRYPDPLQWAVKEKIAEWRQVSAAHIFLGNGSDEVIDLLIRIFCEPGQDAILTLPPTYGMYQVSADIANVEVKSVSLTPDFQPDVPAILAAAESAKLLFLCSPNNPTGNDLDPARIQQLIEGFNGMVVVDEAYIDFSDQPSFVNQLSDYPNLVVMQTFSKAWGMAGIRLGMAFASEGVIALLNKVKPPYNVNLLTQKAALAALEDPGAVRQVVEILCAERDRLQEALKGMAVVREVHPSQANFLLVRMDNPHQVYHYLVKEGIIVRDRSTVHLCEGALRISVGRPAENERLIRSLQAFS